MLPAHISDLHLDGTDRATDRATRVVAYLNSLARQPDAVLVTGDIADHGAPEGRLPRPGRGRQGRGRAHHHALPRRAVAATPRPAPPSGALPPGPPETV
ncbi:hypothetical protein GCM10010207_72460 [Streptomyces atratus]|nr:hypothetical protein GCM10010207_72460 [Streptomyces atratus]